MTRIITIIALLACSVSGHANNDWYEAFKNPAKDAQPWTFWYWMYGCVSDEGIRLDLQAMKNAGIAGFYLMPIKDADDKKELGGTARQLSADWWKRIDTAFRTADELGLQMGIHFSDGFALGGGPWISPEESMQRVVWTDTVLTSNGEIKASLKRPKNHENYYEDIAVYAYPAKYFDDRTPNSSVEFPFRSSEPCDIIMSYDEPYTLHSVEIVTDGNNYQAHRFKVYASDNGTDYRFIREISPARHGWQDTDAYATYAIPATRAKYFKFHWSPEGSNPGSEDMDAAKWKPILKIAGIVMGSEPVIDGYEGKSGAVWRVSKAFDVNRNECVPLNSIQDITSFAKNDSLKVYLPEGDWHILRIGHTSTGHTNATGGGGRGLECDKFSRAAIDKQFDNWFAKIYRHAPQQSVKRVLTRIHVDSWECGSQNWSQGFADEFKARRGYDILPWLAVYAGVPVEFSEDSDRVLRDIRLTIAELINDVFFDEVEKLGKEYGCKLSCECVAPTMVSDGILHYRHADYPMGEFWFNSPTHDKPNDILDAVSGAHIYGKNIVQAEGFTELRGTWDEHPGMLKALLDRNYCLGINSVVFHVYTHNPWTDRAPGMTLDGIGTFFQRDNTWWREMPAFTGYISRCQALLQYGRPVTDIAVYTGDEVPRRAILPERLINSLPGLFGEDIIARERKRLLNDGQPLETSPVGVTHTANITKAEDWINPLSGYKYDSLNHDALNSAHIEDGEIVTQGGARYSALIIPQARPMNPDKIVTCNFKDIEEKGAKVITEPWYGRTLSAIGIEQDAVLPDGIDYIHRKGAEAEIYFLSNQTSDVKVFAPKFRDTRKNKFIADPMTGNVYAAKDTLTLPKHASLFVVFSDNSEGIKLTKEDREKREEMPLENKKWRVTFEKTGKTIKTKELFDWAESENSQIRYYSGHATYETTFSVKEPCEMTLSLGDVQNIATVYVNGINCGTLWTAPFSADITKALRKGKNTLKIEVVNTWANALLGNDIGAPPFKGIWTNGNYRRNGKDTISAGLLGPVMIRLSK